MANAQLSREERAQIERLSEKLGDVRAAAALLGGVPSLFKPQHRAS